MNADKSDRDLIQSYLNGDNNAFCELVRRYRRLVFNLCFRVVGPAEAEDLTQEVFIRLMDKIGLWRAEAKFSTWLYKLALNQCRDYARRRRLEIVDIATDLTDPAPGPPEAAEANERSAHIIAGLMKLPLDHRVPIVLRDIEGLSYAEIAAVTGMELGTVKSRLSRAREQLMKILEPTLKKEHQKR